MKQFIFLLAILSYNSLQAQIGIKDLGKKFAGKVEKNPVSDLLKKPAPITTSLEDVKMDGFLPETFGEDSVYTDLAKLQRSTNGGFILKRGFYEFHDQSYCLKAGTHGPGGGDGYMFAPPLGPKEEIVVSIVRNSVSHPEINQRDIQLLLWSIIARTKFEDLQNRIKVVATLLLTPKQLVDLNGGVIGFIPDALMQKGMEGLPAPVKAVMEAENKLRRMLTDANASFEDMERVAVLAGVAPMGEGSIEVPSGRWSLHPDGYYVRYIPQGYSYTKVQIWVPQGSPSVGKEYDPALHIAVPGNTSRQRLIQSGRAQKQ